MLSALSPDEQLLSYRGMVDKVNGKLYECTLATQRMEEKLKENTAALNKLVSVIRSFEVSNIHN